MRWLIAGITVVLAGIAASLGGLVAGLVALASIGWLLLALRPVEAGAIVADWSRRRFE
jgi:hypothetical protein